MSSPQGMPRDVGMTARPTGAVRQHRKKGAKYLVILTEGGVPPVEQRMPRTRVAGCAAPPPRVSTISIGGRENICAPAAAASATPAA